MRCFPPEDDLLSVAEIAILFKVTDRTVRRWISDGKLKALRVGARVRVRKSDLHEFIRVY